MKCKSLSFHLVIAAVAIAFLAQIQLGQLRNAAISLQPQPPEVHTTQLAWPFRR